jgi:hypothetical protein
VFVLNLIFTPFIPLVCGFYFAVTKNLIFLFIFLITIFVSFEIDVDKQDIHLRIRRLF